MERFRPVLRLATETDLDTVRDMVRAHCREEAPAMPVSEARISAAVQTCVEHQGVIVSYAGREPAGTIGLTVSAPYWSDKAWLIGLWAYVRPCFRKEAHMRTMLEAAMTAAKERHLPLRMEVWGGHRTAGKLHLFARELGGSAGALYFARG